MKTKLQPFLTNHVDIFELLLKTLWKNPIELEQPSTITQEKKKWIMTFPCFHKNIRLEMVIETNKQNKIKRIGMIYKLYTENIGEVEQYLALSFLYECPSDLELCNQYGLYKKEDIETIEQTKDQKKIRNQSIERNLLNNNQFYIFNMNRINDHCADPNLDYVLQQINLMIYEWNSSSK